ncbi:MAG TPA: NHL repeat-containing protein [Planctomycetota bacterium]|nr:NHL repeat-containing protein [Planctomycetota bacterium]
MKAFSWRLAAATAGLLALVVVFAQGAKGEPDKPALGSDVVARVAEVSPNGVVTLDAEEGSAFKDRQVFEIFAETKAYSLPLSSDQKKIRVNRTPVARAVVFQVEAKTARAQLFDEKGNAEKRAPIEKGQVAVLNLGIAAPELAPRIRGHSPVGEKAGGAWRQKVHITLDALYAPGRRAFYEWRPERGTMAQGVEVAPGIYRTTSAENDWIAPFAARTYKINVTITDSAGKTALYAVDVKSLGAKPQERAASPHVLRTLFEKKTFVALHDVAFDARNNMFWLDEVSHVTGNDEFFHGTNADGVDLGSAEVKVGKFTALAVSDDFFFFLDTKEGMVRRYPRGGSLQQVFSGDQVKIGESGSGNGRFKDPVDLACMPDGGVVVLDAGQRCVHRFDDAGRFLYSFGRPGEGNNDLKEPTGLAVALDGTVYVLDNGRKRVVVYKNGRIASDDIEVGIPAEDLRGIGYDDFGGALVILERGNGVVKTFNQTREGWTPASKSASLGSDDVAWLKKPSRVRLDATRVAYVVDRDGESLCRYDVADRADFMGRLGSVSLSDDVKLAATPDSDVVALDKSADVAVRFDHKGWATARMGIEAQQDGRLRDPFGVGCDQDGNVLVADAKKAAVLKFQARGGAFLKSFTSEAVLKNVRYGQISSQREKFVVLCATKDPHAAVIDPNAGDLVSYAPASTDLDDLVLATFSGRFDPSAPREEEGYFWIVDKDGERVSKFTLRNTNPVEITKTFKKVCGVAANVAGAVFLCDRKTKTIEVYASNGSPLTTLQDDQLNVPTDVAADDLGHLYVFDSSKVRILELGE